MSDFNGPAVVSERRTQKNGAEKCTFQILPLMLPFQKALERRVVAQEGIHHKPCAEAEAGDEGV